jgi:hypothetical protein
MRIPLLLFLAACDPSSGGKHPDANADGDADTDADMDADTDADVDTDPATVPLAGPCASADAFGSFTVETNDGLTVVSGAVADGVVPAVVLQSTESAGDCEIVERVALFCDGGCPADQTCGFDGNCIPYPTNQDVGTVSIDGLAAPVSMDPTSPGFNYYDLGLPPIAYDPGALVTLRAEGATLPGFTLHALGLVPLDPPADEWVLSQATDSTITWAAPGGPVRSTVHLLVTIDQHGASPIQLACDFPDTGEGTVAASLVDTLVSSGVTGFPTASLERWTVDSTAMGEGCVQFDVSWAVGGDLRVEGFTPCTEQADCPPGQTCNTNLEICE